MVRGWCGFQALGIDWASNKDRPQHASINLHFTTEAGQSLFWKIIISLLRVVQPPERVKFVAVKALTRSRSAQTLVLTACLACPRLML